MKPSVRDSIKELYLIYTKKRVYRYAAAFSYFVTLSFFPFIILVSIMVAPLHISLESFAPVLEKIIPSGIIDIVLSHLTYVSHIDTKVMMWSAIILLATTASGAIRVLMNIMEDIHGKARFSGLIGFLLSFVWAFAILLFVYLACVIVVAGKWIVNLLEVQFEVSVFASIWIWLRYVILFPLILLFVQCIYFVTRPRESRKHQSTIGALLATCVIVLVSMVFSWILSLTNRYTLVYGSLASVMILMIWLYCCGIVLIMGNAVNVVIDRHKTEKDINIAE